MKLVLLAGGLGTRLSEETHLRPKPMVEIGGRPILWHIMKMYSVHGINDFVICVGYKGYLIKEYFANYFMHMSDVTFDVQQNNMEVHRQGTEPWRVTVIDTGDATMTGGRLKRVAEFLEEEAFCFTYGDGVSDIDISSLLTFHKASGRQATLTAVKPPGRYGAVEILEGGRISRFKEKPDGDGGWINGGFFVLEKSTINLIENDNTSFEGSVLPILAEQGQLSAYKHDGFWRPMDTLRDKMQLEELLDCRACAMEDMVVTEKFWQGKRVLVTGHTGFKGAWLTVWLREMGAKVFGIGLRESPSLFDMMQPNDVTSHILDIRDASALSCCLAECSPDVVFHLAAQPLVRSSYAEPVATWQTNVMGTINLLESLRNLDRPIAAVLIATDKVYQNREWEFGYREVDPLGGHDPYSASKAAMEIAVHSWRQSFFSNHCSVAIASARAGNVLGGGDHARDRIFPDMVRALEADRPIEVRNPNATRPWQHVLEPLAGYLELAERMHTAQENSDMTALSALCSSWNFGPLPEATRSVRDVVETTLEHWPGTWLNKAELDAPHEAKFLGLAIEKATRSLSWYPRWRFETTIEMCVKWHRRVGAGEPARQVTVEQIAQYQSRVPSPSGTGLG